MVVTGETPDIPPCQSCGADQPDVIAVSECQSCGVKLAAPVQDANRSGTGESMSAATRSNKSRAEKGFARKWTSEMGNP